MLEWYEPDPRSAIVGSFETKEAFAEKQVVRGHFHTSVPEDIVKSHKTVEYLMAHAWYHWPMFDEALRKMLGMVEMAVRLRCQALKIAVFREQLDKEGNQIPMPLYTLIKQFVDKEPGKGLKEWLKIIRKLRNYFAHPQNHEFMGAAVIGKIKNLINLINLIFLDEADCIAAKEKTAQFKKEYANFKEGLFVLECNLGRILATEIRLLEAFQVKEDWVYVCFFRPVFRDMLDNLTTQRYVPPPILVLKQPGRKESVFEAVDFETGSAVKVIQTTHPDDQKTWGQHQQDWAQLDLDNQCLYDNYLIHSCGGKLRDFMYEHRWSTPQPPSSI